MKSNARSRARARLATSKPVNVMFSNGLGVCKYGNAGSKSICRKKTRVSTAPGAFITAVVNQFDYQGGNTAKIKLKYKTNIQGAKILLKGKIGGSAVTDLILLTPPVTNDDLYNYYEQTFESTLVGLTDGVVVSDIELTLTGGKISPSGGWNINNVETKIGVPNFTIDLAPPTYSSGIVTDAAPKKIILSFTQTIAPLTLVATDFGVSIDGGAGVAPTAAAIVAGKVELTLAVAVTNAQVVTVGYDKSTTTAQNITDIAGNAVVTFGNGKAPAVASSTVTNAVGAPTYISGEVPATDPTKIILTFDEDVTVEGALVATDFGVSIGGGAGVAPTAAAIVAGKVELTIAAPIVFNAVVTVGYTNSGISAQQIVDAEGLATTTFGGGAAPVVATGTVINNIALAEYSGGEVANNTPNKVVISFDKTVKVQTTLLATDFGVSIGGVVAAPTAAAVVVGTNKIELTVAPVANADVVIVGYTPGLSTNQITDADGNAMLDFGTSKTNPSAVVINRVGAPIFESAVVELATPFELLMTFTHDILANPNISAAAFLVDDGAGGAATAADVAAVVAGKVKLTLAGAVLNSNLVTVAYTQLGGSQNIKGALGDVATFTAQVVTNNT